MQTTDNNYGGVLREARLAKGWTRAELAKVYGRFFHDESISKDTIRMWEDYNKVPKAYKRRQVLAFLLGIPVSALGIEPLASLAVQALSQPKGKGIDVVSASARLHHYKMQNHTTTVGPLLTDILGTIRDIHDEVPYVDTTIRTRFLTLLCDYQQFVGSLYRDQSCYEEALFYQNKAYAVAQSLPESETLALVLWRRGLTYHEAGNLEAAIADFLAAQRYQSPSVHFQGALWSSLGHAQAHHAQTSDELNTALHSFDAAELLLDPAKKEPDDHFIRFNVEGYHLNRASAWVGTAGKTLRSSKHAFDALSLVPPDEDRKRRYAYSIYLQARSWFEQGEYPFATQLAHDAVKIAGEIDSQVNINRVANLYQDLLTTSYKNATDVAELGLELIREQNKGLFA